MYLYIVLTAAAVAVNLLLKPTKTYNNWEVTTEFVLNDKGKAELESVKATPAGGSYNKFNKFVEDMYKPMGRRGEYVGETCQVTSDGCHYVWDGSKWEVDISELKLKSNWVYTDLRPPRHGPRRGVVTWVSPINRDLHVQDHEGTWRAKDHYNLNLQVAEKVGLMWLEAEQEYVVVNRAVDAEKLPVVIQRRRVAPYDIVTGTEV